MSSKKVNILLDSECLEIVSVLPRSFSLSAWIRDQIKANLKGSNNGEIHNVSTTTQ